MDGNSQNINHTGFLLSTSNADGPSEVFGFDSLQKAEYQTVLTYMAILTYFISFLFSISASH